MADNMTPSGNWPNGARAALVLTFDNMGEAADLNRNLWPASEPIGNHYSVIRMIPKFLDMARKYDIKITYFAESWNLGVYPDTIKRIAAEGHEVSWHAWQHEAWGLECKDETVERRNFERSFGKEEGIEGFLGPGGSGEDSKVKRYRGFRPPGGTTHGDRTLKMCREFGLDYISPAAEEAALVPLDGKDSIIVLPFRWRTVDAYYYMDAFGKLRKSKGEFGEEAQTPETLKRSFVKQIDETIEKRSFLSLLFHPFLNDQDDRLQVMDEVLQYLAKRRDDWELWIAPAYEVEQWIREHPDVVGSDPQWDQSSWR